MKRTHQKKKRSYAVRYQDYFQVAGYARHIKRELCIRILWGLLVTGFYVGQAILLAHGIAGAFENGSWTTLLRDFSLAAVCILLRAVVSNYSEGYTKQMGGKIKGVLREKIIDKLLLLGPGYQMDKRAGRFQSLVTDGVEYLEPFFVQFLPQLALVLLAVLPMLGYLFSKSALVGGVVTFSVLLSMLMPHLMMPFYSKANIDYWSDYAVLNASFIDTMQGMNTLKLFHAEKRKGQELREESERFRVKQLINTRNSLVTTGVISLMSAIGTSVVTVLVFYQESGQNLTAFSLLLILFLTIECVRPIGELNLAWHSSMMGFSVVGELLEILTEPIKTRQKTQALRQGMEEGLPSIDFERVSFRYVESREMALNGLDLDVKPGQTVAVVGTSGAGKSTLVNLLLRFYDADQGRIKINGVDLKDYDVEYLRSKIAVVFQNTYLFYGTVRENLLMANPEASEEEMIAAAKAANAHEFIQRLPQGYDTLVSERGDTLSGGQRQRIAIARAILKKAPILIMDEATSSVDGASEHSIQETLEGLQGRFTTLLIAHRLSTIQHAQKIFVLQKGTVAESGTHEELMEKGGIYWELMEAQKGGTER